MTIIGEKIYLTADSSLPECILETYRGMTANDCGSLADTGRVDLSRIKTLTGKPEARKILHFDDFCIIIIYDYNIKL